MKKKTFLIAADSAISQKIIKNNLNRLGYSSVILAENGPDAFAKMHISEIDMVITDLDNHKFDNLRFAYALKSDQNLFTKPILFISKRQSKEDILKAHRVGAAAYIIKPFSVNTFEAKVKEILRNNKKD